MEFRICINEMILSDALELVREGRTPILLTEHKDHAILLSEKLQGRVQHISFLLGSDKLKIKREKLEALRSVPKDETLIVVATGKYVGEGFDEPRLDTMLLAMPISWKGTLAQYAGRLHRSYTGKSEVRIVSPFLQKGRVTALLPVLKNAVALGVEITVCTRPPESYRPNQQPGIAAAISLLKETGAVVVTEAKYQQRCAIMDESIVWYGGIDFLAFGKKDTDVLRFELVNL